MNVYHQTLDEQERDSDMRGNRVAELEDLVRMADRDDPHLRMARLTVQDWERKRERATRPQRPVAPIRSEPTATDEDLERMYVGECRTMQEMAAATGISATTISRRLRSRGVEPTRSKGKTRHFDPDTVQRWYETDGCTVAEIARRMEVCDRTAREYLRRHDIPLRPQGKRTA